MKTDMILWEIVDTLIHPDEQVTFKRRQHPIKWIFALLLFFLIGLVQGLIWLLTIIPTIINKWVLNWRYV